MALPPYLITITLLISILFQMGHGLHQRGDLIRYVVHDTPSFLRTVVAVDLHIVIGQVAAKRLASPSPLWKFTMTVTSCSVSTFLSQLLTEVSAEAVLHHHHLMAALLGYSRPWWDPRRLRGRGGGHDAAPVGVLAEQGGLEQGGPGDGAGHQLGDPSRWAGRMPLPPSDG